MSGLEDTFSDVIKMISRPGISQEESTKGYGKWAPGYEQYLSTKGYSGPMMVASALCNCIPIEQRDSCRVLDVGAGSGLVAVELQKEGFCRLDAMDPSDRMLEEARRKDLYDDYIVAYITKEPSHIPAGTYDALTGSGIYAEGGHVKPEALYEMIRLVKPGGYIVLSTRLYIATDSAACRELEPLMAKLEDQGRWRKVSRDILPDFFTGHDGIVWTYQVM